MVNVSGLRGDDCSAARSSEEQELIKLVRSNVANDSAKVFFVPEPFWSRLGVNAMWAQSRGLQNLADGSCLHQFAGTYGSLVLEALAVHDRIDSFGLFLYPSHFCQLVQGSDPGLVRHVVFAMFHHLDPQRRAVDRNAGADYKLN